MEHYVALTPGELYYLGTIMQAKYIDYAYVAAMEDIHHSRSVYETEARSALISKGIITEDFSGNVDVESKANELFQPIFFGEFESCIDITSLGDDPAVNTMRFHRFNGHTTMVSSNDKGELQISSVDADELDMIAKELLSAGYGYMESAVIEDIPNEKVTRIIAVKNTVIGKSAVVKLFIEADGIIYSENSSEEIVSMTAQGFLDSVLDIIKEGK